MRNYEQIISLGLIFENKISQGRSNRSMKWQNC